MIRSIAKSMIQSIARPIVKSCTVPKPPADNSEDSTEDQATEKGDTQ